MAHNKDSFDRDIARILIDKTGIEYLESFKEYKKSLRNTIIESNFWGDVHLQNLNAYQTSSDVDYRTSSQNNIEAWRTVLSEHMQLPEPVFTLKKKDKSIDITLNGLLALKDTINWFDMYCENPSKYALDSHEKRALFIEFLELEQEDTLYGHELRKKPLMVSYLLDVMGGEIAKSKTDITNALLNSTNMKALFNEAQTEDIQQLFNADSLNSIIKKSQLKDNMVSNTSLLSNLLPIAPPEAWMDAFRGDKKFNTLSFFGPLLKHSNGYTMTELNSLVTGKFINLSKKRSYSSSGQKELIEQIDYLGDNLPEMSKNDSILWYFGILKCCNPELFKKSLDIFKLPERDESTAALYKLFDTP